MNFNRIAPFYEFIERLTTGSRMQRARVAHLPSVADARRVLIAGEGNGKFLAACAKAMPEATFTVIDESPAMLEKAAARWRQAGGEVSRVRFVCDNLLIWTPDELGYDLIVTHFFLDCFPEETLPLILTKLASAAAPNSRWLVADFCEPECGLARFRAHVMLRVAYLLFRLLAGVQASKLVNPDLLLSELGFTLKNRLTSDWGMMHSDLWKRSN